MMPARKYDYYDQWESSDYDKKLNIEEPKHVVRKKPRYGKAVLKVFACMLLVLCVMVLLIQRYAVISETKYRIFSHKTEIKELNTTKEKLNAELDSLFVIENVERIAIEDLNMQYPSASQVVYIGGNSNYAIIEDSFASQTLREPESEFSYSDGLKWLPAKLSKALD